MKYAAMREAKLSEIEPQGWPRRFLELQRDGLTGHLEAAGYPFGEVGFDRPGVCADPEHPNWYSYEQSSYWLDGMVRCAELLDDAFLLEKARGMLSRAFAARAADGFFGPACLRPPADVNHWPHVVFFRALMAEYSATGDRRIVDAVTRHYLENGSDESHGRNVLNAEIMLWAYGESGNEALLKLAERTYADYQRHPDGELSAAGFLSRRRIYAHGVSFHEYAKLGAVLYCYTGKEEYLRPCVNAYRKADRHAMLPDGVHVSNEFLRRAEIRETHETCDISDYTWSLGYLLMATGRAEYADRAEFCVYNAGMGSVTEDFRALQYFSGLNQIVADGRSNHNFYYRGSSWMAYRPNPGTECCPGNVNRFFPNLLARMWMRDGDAVVAVFYASADYRTQAGGREIRIEERTDYPFEERVRFRIRTAAPAAFELRLRVPGWSRGYSVAINGSPVRTGEANGFAGIRRRWSDGDELVLELRAEVELLPFREGWTVRRGPLLYCLGMRGDRVPASAEKTDSEEFVNPVSKVPERYRQEFPSLDFYADEDWSFALDCGSAQDVEVLCGCCDAEPWDLARAPIRLRVPVRHVENWKAVRRRSVRSTRREDRSAWFRLEGGFLFTPGLPRSPVFGAPGTLELVPYGLAKLRIAVFPRVPEA